MPTKQNFVGIFYPTDNSPAPHITIGTPCTRNEVRFCSTENTIPIPSATTTTTQSILIFILIMGKRYRARDNK